MTSTSTDVSVGSVLFTDLVGFTEFTDAVGDSAALSVLDAQTALASAVIEKQADARIVKELGDGLMIWFASADSGLGGAIALMDAIGTARAEGSFPLAVRMGLHHGEVIARGDDLIGQTVNIAARVSALAGPGELLVSDAVLEACRESGDGLSLQPVGPVAVKGLQDPIWLQRLSA